MESRGHNFHRSSSARESREFSAARRHANARMPSTSGYMVAASATAGALFFLLWWMLQGEENPWIPAGLAASVVMLVAVAARAAVIRRAHLSTTDSSDMETGAPVTHPAARVREVLIAIHGAPCKNTRPKSMPATRFPKLIEKSINCVPIILRAPMKRCERRICRLKIAWLCARLRSAPVPCKDVTC